MTTNQENKQQTSREAVILVGRGEKMAMGILSNLDYAKMKWQAKEIKNFTEDMCNQATHIITNMVNNGKKFDFFIVPNLAIMIFEAVGKIKGFENDEEKRNAIVNFAKERVNKIDKNGEMSEENKITLQTAICRFVYASLSAIDRKMMSINKYTHINQLELVVPEGVTLSDGEELTFTNGECKEKPGVKVVGFQNFSYRTPVKVTERNSSYVIFRQHKKNSFYEALSKACNDLWMLCPPSQSYIGLDEASSGDIFAA